MALTALQKVTAAQYNDDTRKIIARGRRTSSSTPASAAQGVLRLDDIAVTGGRIYKVWTNTLVLLNSTAGNAASVRISYTTDGSTPTTASPMLCIGNTPDVPSAGDGANVMLCGIFVAAPGDVLSLLLYTIRHVSGDAGNVSIFAGATPIEMFVEDIGEDPGDTGVDI